MRIYMRKRRGKKEKNTKNGAFGVYGRKKWSFWWPIMGGGGRVVVLYLPQKSWNIGSCLDSRRGSKSSITGNDGFFRMTILRNMIYLSPPFLLPSTCRWKTRSVLKRTEGVLEQQKKPLFRILFFSWPLSRHLFVLTTYTYTAAPRYSSE